MFDQSATFIISVADRPCLCAFDVVAPLIECGLYLEVSIPAISIVFLSHPAIVDVLIGLCGFIVPRNSFDCSAVFLHDFVLVT